MSHILAATKRRQPVRRDPQDDGGLDADGYDKIGDYHGPKRTPKQQADYEAELRRKRDKDMKRLMELRSNY